MSKNIVQFGNGKYAIRCVNWFGFKTYVDLRSNTKHQWTKRSNHFKDCVGTLEEVENCYGYYFEKVVK